MQRDMDLIRKILFVIEGKYVDTWLPGSDVQIDGYDMKTIAYHCALLHDAGLIYDYKDILLVKQHLKIALYLVNGELALMERRQDGQ